MQSLELKTLAMSEIRESLATLRIAQPTAELAMQRSLRTRGQLAPVIVWLADSKYEMVDGFKRLRAARRVPEMSTLTAQVMEGSPTTVKQSMLVLNRPGSGVSPIEEAWVIRSLIFEDRRSQSEVAELLGKHQTWVSRRLALVERLDLAVQEDVRLGLLAARLARTVALMPRGIQPQLVTAIHRDGLSSREVEALAVLLKHTPTHVHPDLLARPREELARRGASPQANSTDPNLRVEARQLIERIRILTARASDLAQTLSIAEPMLWTSRERLVANESLRFLQPSLTTLLEALRRVVAPARAAEPAECLPDSDGPLGPISTIS